MTWGDWICLPVAAIAFWSLTFAGHIEPINWVAFVVIAIADAIGFTAMCLLKSHKPDYGFPQVGKVNSAGLTHSFYHGLNVAAIVLSFWHLFTGDLRGLPMWCLFCGGGLYLVAFIIDIKAGNFEPLKPIKITE